VPDIPGFPAKFVGVDELYAAFLDESRRLGAAYKKSGHLARLLRDVGYHGSTPALLTAPIA
jgi:hypothetical protein